MLSSKSPKYLPWIQSIFITIIILVNLGPQKMCIFELPGWSEPLSVGGGIIFFPVSYAISNILTEVYGYASSRKVIWMGFFSLLLGNIMIQSIVALPASPDWDLTDEYEEVFGLSLRISVASVIAFLVGEFCNSFTLAKLKIITKGKHLWLRTISSTVVAEAFDTALISFLICYGNPHYPPQMAIESALITYVVKVLWEIGATPLTYMVVNWLKKREDLDHYDLDTDFSPLAEFRTVK